MCVRKSYFAYTRKGRISGPVRETAKIARKFIRLNKTNVRKNKIGSYNYFIIFFFQFNRQQSSTNSFLCAYVKTYAIRYKKRIQSYSNRIQPTYTGKYVLKKKKKRLHDLLFVIIEYNLS